jgi:hypothetical protein
MIALTSAKSLDETELEEDQMKEIGLLVEGSKVRAVSSELENGRADVEILSHSVFFCQVIHADGECAR